MKLCQVHQIKSPNVTASLFLMVLLALIATANLAAQAGAPSCPNHKALTLDQVDKLIEQHIAEERTIQLIQACHVDFSMDPLTIQRFASSGTTEQILGTLNRITSNGLTLEHAKAEVPQLEQMAQQARKSVDAERDAALGTMDEAYQAELTRIKQIAPQGQFEPDRDYAQRKLQSQASAATLERKHKANRTQLEDSYNQQAELHAKPYLSRIDFLEKFSYPDPRTIVFTHYDPNSGLLTSTLAGESYQFEQVPPKSAETLYKNWKQARLSQPFEETATHERTLTLGEVSISGYSLKAKEAILLRQKQYENAIEVYNHLKTARVDLAQQKIDDADKEYQAVLKLDPANQEANQEIAAIEAQLKNLSEFAAEQKNAGIWIDDARHEMWPLHDNGSDVNWKSATEYCQALRLGGFSDWRLPSNSDIEPMFRGGSTKMTSPHSRTKLDLNSTNFTFSRKEKQPAKPYHIAGDILLSEVFLWTTSPGPHRGEYLLGDFNQGHYAEDLPNAKDDYRALCVRSFRLPTADARLPVPTTPLVPPARPDETTQ